MLSNVFALRDTPPNQQSTITEGTRPPSLESLDNRVPFTAMHSQETHHRSSIIFFVSRCLPATSR